eukprot:8691072-Lingulodinium_polyedra.AAC.1
MIASNDRGSQIKGVWMFSPAQARSCVGPFPTAVDPPLRGASESERRFFGERIRAVVDDGTQLTEANDYPPELFTSAFVPGH